MSMPFDHISVIKGALAGATASDDPMAVAFYLGSARAALLKAKEDIAGVELMLIAREREAVARFGPKQLEIGAKK